MDTETDIGGGHRETDTGVGGLTHGDMGGGGGRGHRPESVQVIPALGHNECTEFADDGTGQSHWSVTLVSHTHSGSHHRAL